MGDRMVALVTGCAKGGIDHEYCKTLAERNCHVFASDIPQRMKDMLELTSSHSVEALELDVTSDESVASAIEAIMSKFGRIDVIINNAGIGSVGLLAELPLDAIRKAWEINTLGQLRLVQTVVPHMAAWRSGNIVNVGSVVGMVPTPWGGSSRSSKAAVHAMTDALWLELRPFGIKVVKVIPGAIRLNFGSATTEKLGAHEWSLYKPFAGAIAERAVASQSAKLMDAVMFARHVVNKVLSPRPPRQIVFGHMTGLFAVLSVSPLRVRDLFVSNRFGVNRKL